MLKHLTQFDDNNKVSVFVMAFSFQTKCYHHFKPREPIIARIKKVGKMEHLQVYSHMVMVKLAISTKKTYGIHLVSCEIYKTLFSKKLFSNWSSQVQ